MKQKEPGNGNGIKDIFKKIKKNEDSQKQKAQAKKIHARMTNTSLQTAFYSGHDVSQDKGDAMANRVKAIAEKYKVQEEIKEDEEKPSQMSLPKPSASSK